MTRFILQGLQTAKPAQDAWMPVSLLPGDGMNDIGSMLLPCGITGTSQGKEWMSHRMSSSWGLRVNVAFVSAGGLRSEPSAGSRDAATSMNNPSRGMERSVMTGVLRSVSVGNWISCWIPCRE